MNDRTEDAPGGTRGSRRLPGVDAARGVALVGMMAIHVLPTRDPDGTESVAFLLAHGRSAAAFALLAGVGLALLTARARARGKTGDTGPWADVTGSVVIRGLAIGTIGLALGYLDSGVAVILAYYGVFFLLAVPLLRLGPGALAGLAVATAVVVPFASHLLRGRLVSSIVTGNATFADLVYDPAGLLNELLLTGYYPVLAWSTYLCAGLAVGQLRLRSPRVAAGLLGVGATVAVAAPATSWLLLDVLGGRRSIAASLGLSPDSAVLERMLSESQYGTTPPTTWWWLAVGSPHSSTPIDLAHTTGTALALLGAALLIAHVARPALLPLAAAGSMTLTLYTAHVVALALPAMGLPVLPADPTASYLLQVAAALALATAWRSVWRRGPLEELVASLTRLSRRVPRPNRTGAG